MKVNMDKTHDYPVELLGYLVNLAEDKVCAPFILMDEYVFSTYFTALLQGLPRDGLDSVLRSILKKVHIDLSNFEHADAIGSLEKQEKLMQIVNNLRSQFSENITTTYVKDFFLSTAIYRELQQNYKIASECVAALEIIVNSMFVEMSKDTINQVSSLTQNLSRISSTINLTAEEGRLMELNLLFSTDIRSSIFRDFLFTITKNPSLFEHFYKVMLGCNTDASDIDEALSERSKPIALGIVNYDLKSKRMSNMSEFWIYVLANYAENDEKFFSRFVEELKGKKKTFSGSIAKAAEVDEAILTKFLEKAYDIAEVAGITTESSEESVGLNLMMYGAKQLDKIGYVNELLDKMSLQGMVVRTRDAKAHDIPGICYIAQQRVKELSDKLTPIILIVEKAEQALTKRSNTPSWMVDMFEAEGTKKADGDLESDELLLIKNPIPTIWLVNSPSSVIPDNIGRFLFHVELKGGSRADRREEVQNVVKELGFSDDLSAKLSKYIELNVQQIKSAARTVIILDRKGAEGEESLIHLIGNSQKALNREKMEDLRDSVTKYSLEYLNLGGGMPIDKIVASLKRKTQGTMCLYGPPGTGKTQLAEYIAMQLDKPLLIKPASELLSMYLGESEKNIAKMFEEARSEGSILLLDEADSFLRDRALSKNSWEVTQVNELLQRMERFQGLFICATNLFSSLDAAALRRFTFKLEFKALTNDQRYQMLENESGADFSAFDEAYKEDLMMELALIKHLTPGDFATVRRQAILLDETLSIDTWLDRLDIESKSKMLGLERNGMGFIPATSGPSIK